VQTLLGETLTPALLGGADDQMLSYYVAQYANVNVNWGMASALGAARAFQEAGRESTCAIVGQNAEPDARAELRAPHTPLVGSIAYFPERYGEDLVRLALDILSHRPVPPAVFVRHQVITSENVDRLYPNDRLLAAGTGT
jgi:ABC-type sugar transport system substrate-binding protein